MISTISGTITAITDCYITIQMGPIGLKVQVSQAGGLVIKEEIHLFAHMYWNSEQGPSLFGFKTELERAVFLLVISCSGLGPKIGLAILADIGPQNFLQAVQTGDEKVLSTVSGIGAKKAEQMIVQLKHKVAKLLDSGIEIKSDNESFAHMHHLNEVLKSLNYSRTEITNAMTYVRESCGLEKLPFDGLMRKALYYLAKRK